MLSAWMLLNVSDQLEDALPPGIETQGDVEDVVRLIARAILDLHGRPGYLGFLRMVAADSRRIPWIGEAFAAIPVEHRRRGAPLAGFTLAGHQSLGWSLPSEPSRGRCASVIGSASCGCSRQGSSSHPCWASCGRRMRGPE